jgi:hypothetical protein
VQTSGKSGRWNEELHEEVVKADEKEDVIEYS